ncbi:heme peroxidase [Chiua virens]|nr:heme peroxidase [Chiua virens]
MQQMQSKASRGTGKTMQGALQMLLSRVESGISEAASIAHLRDLERVVRRGPPLTLDDLPAFADALRHLHGGINDRDFLLEKILVILARLPDDSAFGKVAQQYVISLLFRELPHPSTGFLSTFHNDTLAIAKGLPVSYAYRSPDGSNYNVLLPTLGQAGLVFDRLLCRGENHFVPHPGGLSSLFFAFADLIIHSVFNTKTSDWTINDASSYLDLSIIYGNSVEQTDKMRQKDGTGKIWDDTFADKRLLFMPPSVGALAVLFSRHHNYIAQKILALNERASFISPQPGSEVSESLQTQDDEIYNRARMVNTAFFMKIILADYVGAILGLVRDGMTWRLDPLSSYRETDHTISPRGEGNAVSVEFNLLYRWHASVCEEDEIWLNGMFNKLFPGANPKTMTPKDLGTLLREKVVPPRDVKTWTFGGLERGPDGRFADQDLARILQDGTERRAGAFRARGCPAVMRAIEMLAVEQGRKWGTCTLNEFRSFVGLRPYKSFEEWNPDPVIHNAAQELYGHIDNLELHVGLQAEETKPPIPGSGLCPGYTMSRAILADAVCLTRGDRFLTVDFTPYNLTSWGYQHCMVNSNDSSYGGMISRMLFQLLPDQYPAGSIYGCFPFMTPDFMRLRIAERSTDLLMYYDFQRPAVNANEHQPNVLYKERASKLTKGVEVSFTEVQKRCLQETLSVESFEAMFNGLMKKASTRTNNNVMVIDIVKDVINLVPIYWAANFVLGLPITTVDMTLGGHTVMQWFELFADVTRYMYLNDKPDHDWTLYQAALKAADEIMLYLCNRLKRHKNGLISLASTCDFLITSVLASERQSSVQSIACSIFSKTVPSALLFSLAISSVIEYYADPVRKEELEKLIQLCTATSKDPGTNGTLLMRMIEVGMNGSLANVGADGKATCEENGVHDAPSESPSPPMLVVGDHKIDIHAQGGLVSRELFKKLAPRMISAIFSLKNIRFPEGRTIYDGRLPVSKVIQYDV